MSLPARISLSSADASRLILPMPFVVTDKSLVATIFPVWEIFPPSLPNTTSCAAVMSSVVVMSPVVVVSFTSLPAPSLPFAVKVPLVVAAIMPCPALT